MIPKLERQRVRSSRVQAFLAFIVLMPCATTATYWICWSSDRTLVSIYGRRCMPMVSCSMVPVLIYLCLSTRYVLCMGRGGCRGGKGENFGGRSHSQLTSVKLGFRIWYRRGEGGGGKGERSSIFPFILNKPSTRPGPVNDRQACEEE